MTGGNVNVDNDICLFFGKHLALATNLFIFDHFKSVGVTSWYIVQNLQDLSSPVSSCISFNPSLVCVALLKHQIRDFTHSSVIIQIHECSYLHLLINHNHIILQTSLQCQVAETSLIIEILLYCAWFLLGFGGHYFMIWLPQ